jgi:hypothetical protein
MGHGDQARQGVHSTGCVPLLSFTLSSRHPGFNDAEVRFCYEDTDFLYTSEIALEQLQILL